MKRFVPVLCLVLLSVSFTSCDALLWSKNSEKGTRSVDDGLVTHYPLNGTGEELVAERDGTVIGAVPAADRFGNEGGALSFDGFDDYMIAATPEDGVPFNFDLQTQSYTISLWANAENPAEMARLLSKWNEQTTSPYAIQINKVGDEVWGSVFDRSEATTAAVSTVWDEEWRHIAVTFNSASRTLTTFVDGRRTAVVSSPFIESTSNGAPLYIGRAAPPREDRHFEGRLDDVRIYERVLTNDEVKTLYLATE